MRCNLGDAIVFEFRKHWSLATNSLLQLHFLLKYNVEQQKSPILLMHLSLLCIYVIAGSSQYLIFFQINNTICLDGNR